MYNNVKLMNPFQINDWKFKKFLYMIVSIQFSTWGLIGLDLIGLHIPILRQLISFIYLTFVPGFLILRVLKLHRLGNEETLLYTIGLSISFLMFTGFLINFLYPWLGIKRPISIEPLVITISIVVLILCVIAYVQDKNYSSPSFINFSDLLSPALLFFCLMPFFSIFGTYLVNLYNENIVTIFLLSVISITPIIIAYYKIPDNLYSIIVLSISISLLYHRSLISMNLWGWDIHTEYYFAKQVIDNSIWASNIYANANSLLSITMLPPIYSIICNLGLKWIFKIIYPLFFSLVPFGLYLVYKKQTDNITAFMSAFFFMSIFSFYNELTTLPRQEMAELFLTLLILLMINKTIENVSKSILVTVFTISLIVSHYALTYIYLYSLITIWLILFFVNNPYITKRLNYFNKSYKSIYPYLWGRNFFNSLHYESNVNSSILFTFVCCLCWYMYIGGASSFEIIVSVINRIAVNFFTDFSSPAAAEGVRVVVEGTTSLFYSLLKLLHLITQFFIVIGILELIINSNKMKFNTRYALFSIINLLICAAAVVVPYFAVSLTVTRLYHITTIFLAPFCVIGGKTFLMFISKLSNKIKINIKLSRPIKVLSVFFTIFLLFNTGLIQQIITSDSYSISLDNTKDYPRFNDKEIDGATWLMSMSNISNIYADSFGRVLLTEYVPYIWNINSFDGDTDQLPNDAYIFFRNLNTNGSIMTLEKNPSYEKPYNYIPLQKSNFFNKVIIYRDKIYANGGSEVYR